MLLPKLVVWYTPKKSQAVSVDMIYLGGFSLCVRTSIVQNERDSGAGRLTTKSPTVEAHNFFFFFFEKTTPYTKRGLLLLSPTTFSSSPLDCGHERPYIYYSIGIVCDIIYESA